MINPYINYPLDNSRKVAPVATSVAPVVAGHCTHKFVLTKSHICPNITAYNQSMTVWIMYNSFPIYAQRLKRKLLEDNAHVGKFHRWRFHSISKPGWLTN